jgi:hypothetical protein
MGGYSQTLGPLRLTGPNPNLPHTIDFGNGASALAFWLTRPPPRLVASVPDMDGRAAKMAAVREVGGWDFGIGIDFHGRVRKGMAKVLAHGEPSEILKTLVDYDKVNGTGLQIARLDQMATRKLMGM